jgi:hypothetical protein
MTRNLKIFIGMVVLGTTAYLALSDLLTHFSDTVQTIGGFAMLLLFFYIVFNFVHRVIYRLTGVTGKLMFRGRSEGWPRPTHRQAAEINRYWLVWIGGSLITYIAYTLLFHRLEWKNALVFCLIVILIVYLARQNSKHKIAGHTKKDLFK